jgi:RNA polymerase sigma-70 factor (ECF subfamily)
VSDADLVARARQGDADAFGELVERHRAAVYRAALAVLGVPEDAEEAAQDAFVLAYRKLEGFRGDASFKTWVLAIVWRQALDRRQSLMRTLKRFVSSDDEGWIEAVGDEALQERALADAQLRRQVRRLIRALSPRVRDALLLIASGDYSYEEAAQALGEPTGTVKWRVMEARRQIRRKLARLGYVAEQ